MDKELIDRTWACLPREFREEVKKIYNADAPLVFPEENELLDYIFGEHNLTSDAEGEEMLMVSRKQIDVLQGEIFKAIMDAHDADDWQDAAHYILDVMPRSFATLFGPKCPPDGDSSNVDEIGKDCNVDSSEPKSAESKYIVGDKVMYKGVIRVIDSTDTTHRYHLSNGNYYAEWVNESDLEPYTEPKEENHIVENHEMVDNILKDGFREHNRLHIAAMAMQGLLNATSVERFTLRISPKAIAEAAFEYADALINMNKKGGLQ